MTKSTLCVVAALSVCLVGCTHYDVTAEPKTLNFGDFPTGQNSMWLTVNWINKTDHPLQVEGFVVPSPFATVPMPQGLPFTLEPGKGLGFPVWIEKPEARRYEAQAWATVAGAKVEPVTLKCRGVPGETQPRVMPDPPH